MIHSGMGSRMYSRKISPRIDTTFAHRALDFIETGDQRLLSTIADTEGARHLAAHARWASTLTGEASGALDLVSRILTSPAITAVDPHRTRKTLSLIEENLEAQQRCWDEASSYLPPDALSETRLFFTVGYDIGVAVSGNASVNIAHKHFSGHTDELWFYCVHELHHAGFQKYNPLPALAEIRTAGDLSDLITYLTTMEGMAVHAALNWRTKAGALCSDSDYAALSDAVRMDMYERDFFSLYRDLAAKPSSPLQRDDWNILGRMSTGDRLWYRVGAKMAHEIDKEFGREILIGTVLEDPAVFFSRYAALIR